MALHNHNTPGASSTGRQRTRQLQRAMLEQGTVAESYRGDHEALLRLLNDALAAELACVLRYRRHYFVARSLASSTRIAEEFLVHSDEELAHADQLADRIVQLGGEPDFAPERLRERASTDHVPASSLVEMLRENLVAERTSIETYRGIIETVGETDPTTRRMLEGILGVEEAHADELSDILDSKPQI
jgi:bacterioferritin